MLGADMLIRPIPGTVGNRGPLRCDRALVQGCVLAVGKKESLRHEQES